MRIRTIDFAEPLIEAKRAGNLVIFVGAGASRDAPSDLPDFRTLTAEIAAEARMAVTEAELIQPDVVLGRLADRQVNVHQRVATRLGRATSQPNRLHQAIAELVATGPSVRIVTTNYDTHLSTVLATLGVEVVEYRAPALPMGDDFTGLLYLHGSLRQEPRHLVVTDADFGRAYLRDAWAARFLERMFMSYTVLFIGYSHADVVMRYLARALGPGAPRYALTSNPDAPNWRQLGIHPIGYGVVGDSHEELVDAIEGWASYSAMGLLEHRQQIARLVSGPPSQVPEEASYLEAIIADGRRVPLFVELARGEEWLSWAAAQPEFRRLFDPMAATTECTVALAHWFVRHFVMEQELTGAALTVVREAGGRLGPSLWATIGHHLHIRGAPRPEWLGAWLVLLIEDARIAGRDWLEYALAASRWPEDRAVALLLFDHLTRPRVTLQSSFGLDDAPRFDVGRSRDAHRLRDVWRELFVPNLPEAASPLLVIVDRQLRRTHQMLAATGAANPGWDSVSFRRKAIDPHGQDRSRDVIDVLIDAARDSLEALLTSGDSLAALYLHSWAASEEPILRRLAVHGWAQRTDVDASAKIVWIRERGWLFDHQLRNEVFRLIARALPAAIGDVADALVADVVVGPDAAGPDEIDDDEHRAYERFNALAWITRHAPDLTSAREALELVQSEHPHFEVRPHPGLLSWSESGMIGAQPPMTVVELHDGITDDAAVAIAELRGYENKTSPFEGPTWSDALAVLIETVGEHPGDGLAVLDAEGGDHTDFVRAVIRGWTAAALDTEAAEPILARLADVDLASVSDDVARLLSGGGRSDTNPTEWHRLSAARALAADLWTALDSGPTVDGLEDAFAQSVNSPAGHIARFWVSVVAAEWRAAGDSWVGLPADTRAQLEVLLAGHDHRTAMAEVILATDVQFFFVADRAWCELFVLPLLDWARPDRARRTWDGFLMSGRWDNQLLAAGLLEQYLAAAAHIADFREELRRQLCGHLASVAVTSEPDLLEWLRTFIATVDVGHRVEWAHQVAWLLRKLPAEAVEHQWDRWMRQYWQDRLESVPLQLTVDEASAMAGWVVHLTDSIEEGAELAMLHPAGLGEHGDLLHELDDDRIDRSPTGLAKLLAHLLRGTEPPFWGGYDLDNIVPRLRDRADPVVITAIVEEAMRLGCGGAHEW